MSTATLVRTAVIRRTRKRRTRSASAHLAETAKKRLEEHQHFHGRSHLFQIYQVGDVLTVRGKVPCFYLRRLLQKVLRGIEGVRSINNEVDVVSSRGLSSLRRSSRFECDESSNPIGDLPRR